MRILQCCLYFPENTNMNILKKFKIKNEVEDKYIKGLVDAVFITKEKELTDREVEILEREVRNKIEVNKIKASKENKVKSVFEIMEEKKALENELNELKRKEADNELSKNKIKTIQAIIDFIDNWLLIK